ncbi:uncharacterized protein K460DRAFT_194239 [Cucurbitaria berberidis CBS 394.84]|uniref:Uncharacterized protein n=1 Tax=Cucurbitaria berberidis CBS 394.84 TaxID=1168544 RepID=A0A9P4G8C2_9PLEO|nr:uncharacterized protein K460DRAFT_194239 [Cucurbitaria berberidis CBS 394.84]KAF1840901.1 hypothetical protein K460DRAFT_194239 [Cucurbitaria berberidis CBS 394.84]
MAGARLGRNFLSTGSATRLRLPPAANGKARSSNASRGIIDSMSPTAPCPLDDSDHEIAGIDIDPDVISSRIAPCCRVLEGRSLGGSDSMGSRASSMVQQLSFHFFYRGPLFPNVLFASGLCSIHDVTRPISFTSSQSGKTVLLWSHVRSLQGWQRSWPPRRHGELSGLAGWPAQRYLQLSMTRTPWCSDVRRRSGR